VPRLLPLAASIRSQPASSRARRSPKSSGRQDDLARLIGQHEQADADDLTQREQPGSGFFSRAAADRERRRRELLGALTGRPRQERDEQGRLVSGGFDGGSRTPPLPPAPTHDQTLRAVPD